MVKFLTQLGYSSHLRVVDFTKNLMEQQNALSVENKQLKAQAL